MHVVILGIPALVLVSVIRIDEGRQKVPAVRVEYALLYKYVVEDQKAGPDGYALVEQAAQTLALQVRLDSLEVDLEVAREVVVEGERGARNGRASGGRYRDCPVLVLEIEPMRLAVVRCLQEASKLVAQLVRETESILACAWKKQMTFQPPLGHPRADVDVWDGVALHVVSDRAWLAFIPRGHNLPLALH